jgi:hypothetical protein
MFSQKIANAILKMAEASSPHPGEMVHRLERRFPESGEEIRWTLVRLVDDEYPSLRLNSSGRLKIVKKQVALGTAAAAAACRKARWSPTQGKKGSLDSRAD